ncbi:MAG: agmatine deiminase family protein [Planctomycetota bacterium]|nr:agmatine deiminase family protein [Planctomycetota bacterium]
MSASGKPFRLHWPLGVILGLVAALLAMPLLKSTPRAETTVGPVLSDCDGAMHELVIQYTSDSAEIVAAPFRDFLTQLPKAVTVHVVCRDRAAFDDLKSRVGETACTLNPVFVDHPITSWSRDRWICLRPAGSATAFTVLSPQGEMGADAWPERKGDEQLGDDLAAALAPHVAAVRSPLWFDGGDFVCDEETAFVTPNVRKRNLQNTVKSEEELLTRLREITGRKVVLLKTAPDHHAGMYMMAVGNRTVLVGDPRLTRDLLGDEAEQLPLPPGLDNSDECQARFDAVAEQCREAGYNVVRIPIAPGKDGRMFLTYLNVILDQRDGQRVVYMPVFDGAERLNEAAAQVWEKAGYEVKRVNCTDCYKFFGSLRCLVNVLKRG